MQPEQVQWFFIWFVCAGIIGFLFNRIRVANASFGQRNRPLDTFPDAAQPGLSSARIVRRSFGGLLSCIFWLMILVGFIVGLGYVYQNWDTLPFRNLFLECYSNCWAVV